MPSHLAILALMGVAWILAKLLTVGRRVAHGNSIAVAVGSTQVVTDGRAPDLGAADVHPYFEQFDNALEANTVCWTHVCQAHYLLRHELAANSALRQRARAKQMAMMDSFRTPLGEILDHYLCINAVAGAVLIRDSDGSVRLHITIAPSEAEITRLLSECERLGHEIAETLKGHDTDRELALRRVCAVTRGLLAALDTRIWENSLTAPDRPASAPAAPPAASLSSFAAIDAPASRPLGAPFISSPGLDDDEAAIQHARRYFETIVKREFVNSYFLGAIVAALGIVSLALVLGIMAMMNSTFAEWLNDAWIDQRPNDSLLVCLLAGGVGSIVSVLERVRNWDLHVAGVPTRHMIVALGATRLLIGSIFAVLIYGGIRGDLIPIAVPPENTVYFWLVVGFISGFSERFAPDALAVTEQRLTSRD